MNQVQGLPLTEPLRGVYIVHEDIPIPQLVHVDLPKSKSKPSSSQIKEGIYL